MGKKILHNPLHNNFPLPRSNIWEQLDRWLRIGGCSCSKNKGCILLPQREEKENRGNIPEKVFSASSHPHRLQYLLIQDGSLILQFAPSRLCKGVTSLEHRNALFSRQPKTSFKWRELILKSPQLLRLGRHPKRPTVLTSEGCPSIILLFITSLQIIMYHTILF